LSLRSGDQELQEIISELDALTGKLSQNEKNLEQLTVVDPLTCVYNRRYFGDRLKEEFKRFIRYNTLFSIAIVDVDHFKKINDTYGHQMGDVVLKDIARILKENSRETDIVARYGGEEFVILYTCTDKIGSQIHLERLRTTIENFSFPDIPQNVTVSIGVSDATGKIAAEDVVRDADSALYSAKRGGRNRSVVYSSPITGNGLSKDPLSVSRG
jgi:diguanylate cyclase (GGDEF)-like protein